MEYSRVELHEFHVGYCSLGTIHHGDTVASGNNGIRGGEINGTTPTRTHHRDFRKISIHLLRLRIEHICTIALNVGRATGDTYTQMMLGDDLHGEMVLLDVDIGIVPDGFH